MGLTEDAIEFNTALTSGARADLRGDVIWQIFDAVGHQPIVTCGLIAAEGPGSGCYGTLLLLTNEAAAVVTLSDAPWNGQSTPAEMIVDVELLRRSDLRSVLVRSTRRGVSFAGDKPEQLHPNSEVEVRYRDHGPMVFRSESVAYRLDEFVGVLRADLAR